MNEAATALLHPSFHPSHPLLLLAAGMVGQYLPSITTVSQDGRLKPQPPLLVLTCP